jgi:hypothetical protein
LHTHSLPFLIFKFDKMKFTSPSIKVSKQK